MSEEKEFRNNLLDTFIIKTSIKQEVYQNTLEAFIILRKVLKQLERDYINILQGKVSPSAMPKYKERGPFDVEFKIGGDLLIFSMHSNIFEFDRDHPVWNLKYVKDNAARSYCGMIYIYNFLDDSFRFNRPNDLGYLVARLFINSEKHFFVEGKRQSDELLKDFEVDTISPGFIRQIIEIACQYSIQFDLLVPPYDQVKMATVEQMLEKINHSKIATGKRLGFSFNTDDV